MRNSEWGMRNKERRSWEAESSKLNAQREPSAVGGALRLRFEVGGRKGLSSPSPQSTNQRINQSTRPD